jgi:Peptidase M66
MRVVALLLLVLLSGCGSPRPTSERSSGGAGGAFADLAGSPSAGDGGAEAPATLGGADGEPDAGAEGQLGSEYGGDAGIPAEGGAAGCDSSDELSACAAAPALGLALDRIAFFQGVKVPIMEQMLEVTNRRAEAVAGRAGLFRVYAAPNADFQVRSVRAHLTLQSTNGKTVGFDQTQLVSVASTDGSLSSTFNFGVPAESVSEGLAYSVELFEVNAPADVAARARDTRFPVHGLQLLGVKAASRLRVEVVPVEFDIGQISLLPDISTAQLARFRTQVQRFFPISELQISVRDEPLRTTSADLATVLDQVAALRDTENVDPDLTYFGVVRFTDTIAQYCNPSCVLGASYTGTTPMAGVGVGVSYTGDQAALTFAHELGHVYGRSHTPCGVAGDPNYPYSGGRIGDWGYDVATKALFDPNDYADFMGYCAPVWVSDFTYEHLRQFIAAMPPPIAKDVVSMPAPSTSASSTDTGRVRALLLQAGRAPRWGLTRPARGLIRGDSEQATTYDAQGSVVGSVTVRRARATDLALDVVYVPEPAPSSWVSVRAIGQPAVRYGTNLSRLPSPAL